MPTAGVPSQRESSGRRPAVVRAPSLPLGLPRRRMCCVRPWRGGRTAESTFATRRSPVLTPWPRLGRCSAAVRNGAFDLVLVGRNSLDGDTGQVGPEIAQLSGLPFASGVRVMGYRAKPHPDPGAGRWLGRGQVSLPALLSVAERFCEPCKVLPPKRAEVRMTIRSGSGQPRVGRWTMGGGWESDRRRQHAGDPPRPGSKGLLRTSGGPGRRGSGAACPAGSTHSYRRGSRGDHWPSQHARGAGIADASAGARHRRHH